MIQIGDIVGTTPGHRRSSPAADRGPGRVVSTPTAYSLGLYLVRWEWDGFEELCDPRSLMRLHFPPNPHTDLCHHERAPDACRVLADWLREQGYPGCAARVLSSPARRAPVLRAVARRGRTGMGLAVACGYVAPDSMMLLGVDHGAPDGGAVAVFRLENGQIVLTGNVQRTRILATERAEDGSGRPVTLEITYQDEPHPRLPAGYLGAEIRQFAQAMNQQLVPEFERLAARTREAAVALTRIPADRVYPPTQFAQFITSGRSLPASVTALRVSGRRRTRQGPPPAREWWRR